MFRKKKIKPESRPIDPEMCCPDGQYHCWIKQESKKGVYDVPVFCRHGIIRDWLHNRVITVEQCHLCGRVQYCEWGWLGSGNLSDEQIQLMKKSKKRGKKKNDA